MYLFLLGVCVLDCVGVAVCVGVCVCDRVGVCVLFLFV